MEILSKILGGQARVKIMRLFLQSKGKTFPNKEIVARTRVPASAVRRELALLSSVGFIKKRRSGSVFDTSFKYTRELESLLISTDTVDRSALTESFKRTGKLKFLVVSGLFIKNKDSRVDVLVVGDKLQKSRIEESMRRLEAEIGAEMTYASFTTKEFIYRLNMYDKLVRDILDYPHEVIFQAKDLSFPVLKKK